MEAQTAVRHAVLLIVTPLLAVTSGGLAFSLALVLQSDLTNNVQSLAPLYEGEKVDFGLPASPAGKPVRLIIPKIHVDAVVESVGVDSHGAMDVPKDPDSVAWFDLGMRPGESGSAVISGHYGWKNGRAAAFDNLYTLRAGDTIYVEDDEGVITTFVVRESRKYDPDVDASEVFGSYDGKSHLNLITCEGVWNELSKSYSKRLVVFTERMY